MQKWVLYRLEVMDISVHCMDLYVTYAVLCNNELSDSFTDITNPNKLQIHHILQRLG